MPVWLSLIGVVVVVVSGALQQLLVASGQPALVEAALSWRNVVVVGAAIPIALAMLSGYAVRWLWEAVQRRLPAAPTRQRVVAAFFVLCVAGQIGWLAVAAIPLVETTHIPADSAALVALLADQPLGFVETEQDIQYLAVLRGGHKNFWKLFYPYHLADAYPLVPPRYRIGAADTLPAAGWVEIATVDALVLTANTDPAAGYATTTEPVVVIDRDCRVVSEAGAIALDCSAPVAFPLVVHEYALPGWEAYIDGEPVPLATGDFLAVGVPAGTHRIDFAYRAWLVIAAASLSFVAWVVVCALVLREVLQQNSR